MAQNRTGNRRPGERYYTPTDAVKVLLKFYDLKVKGYILEPCVGTGAIVQALREEGFSNQIVTNDIDKSIPAMLYRDASKLGLWQALHENPVLGDPDWVITNPPFSLAWDIIQYAYFFAKSGVIFFLPQTWTEPTLHKPNNFLEFKDAKDYWLYKNTPTKQLVLPRISFTGDGRQAPVTNCWYIWDKHAPVNNNLIIIPRQEVKNILIK